jgi:sn-glycerol 3-phosphate transport system permease protein
MRQRPREGSKATSSDVRRARPRPTHDVAWFVALTTPALLLLAVFTFWPIVQSFALSFTDWNMIRPVRRGVGWENYRTLLTSPAFWDVVQNTALFTFFTVFIRLALSLLLAQLLIAAFPLRAFVRTLVFLPHVTTTAAVALVFLFIFDPYFGPLRPVFEALGLRAPVWVAESGWAMAAIVIASIWKGLGFSTVVYLAGLSAVDKELQEAARIDGASEWRVFRHVTFPQLSPVTLFLVITGILHAMQQFDFPALMTQGGPLGSTKTYVYYLYELGFQRFRAGYASALASVFFVVMLAITLVNLRLSRRWVTY